MPPSPSGGVALLGADEAPRGQRTTGRALRRCVSAKHSQRLHGRAAEAASGGWGARRNIRNSVVCVGPGDQSPKHLVRITVEASGGPGRTPCLCVGTFLVCVLFFLLCPLALCLPGGWPGGVGTDSCGLVGGMRRGLDVRGVFG